MVITFVLATVTACTTTVPAPVTSKTAKQDKGKVSVSQSGKEGIPASAVHVVNSGDTLYAIAWRYQLDYKDVARWNGIRSPYVIYPRQRIRLKPPVTAKPVKPLQPGPVVSGQPAPVQPQPKKAPGKVVRQPGPVTGKPAKPVAAVSIKWQWPTRGKMLKSGSAAASKGLDFRGESGQKIVAAAAGEVVYSGSGLLGYGKLIIIKHNETYLSAYAYNKKIMVSEGDTVTAGQQIATMGIGIKGLPTLHFEIRKNGKPADPLKYLPTQKT